MAKSKRRKKLTVAQIEKRENYKWGIMFFATLTTIVTYLAIFAEELGSLPFPAPKEITK